MIKKVLALVAVAVLVAGCPSPKNPIQKLTSVGDGRWTVGTNGQLRIGTWYAANTGPHTPQVRCEWTVTKESHEGTVDVRSADTDNKVQQVFLGNEDIFEAHNCGTWAWLTDKNLT